MQLAEALRHQHLYRTCDQLMSRVAEESFRLGAHHTYKSPIIDHHHSVGRGLDCHSESVLSRPALCDVAEDQRRAKYLSFVVNDRRAAIVNRYFSTVLCNQDGVIGQPDDLALFNCPQCWIIDR